MSDSWSLVSRNTCNSATIKNLVKNVKYFECLSKFYSTISGNVAHSCWCENCVIFLPCAI